ncbi:cystine ABC transporter substrate-binding protein [Bartonella sp. HY329]|uniref:cystine ABC transporter substrate-binding protein n=1 Tax=unclassified Bartonella TaxID=2645622 RepID=UPI0021C84082|nr:MULTISPECIES: cystine ABC transporter substrate-binding protein [unclassified Bartonella]UXM95042.1 cystine ABC transporter substrate-binding protein [Bartonella sp. HY329]UXN09365.1 cystine ABC transporter substrate-binding protein [Bartonella sp. HY328]
MTHKNRRHFIFATLLGLASLLASTFAHADIASGVPESIAKKGELAIGVEGTYPPFNYQDENGDLVGFEIDFTTEVAKRLGLKAKFYPTKWDGILASLGSGRIDVIANQVTITPEREKAFDFSIPYTISGIQIITRPELKDELTSPEKLAGHAVGVGLGTHYEQWLNEHVPGVDVRTYDDEATKYNDLKAKRTDAVLNDRLVAADYVKKTGNIFVPAGEPFAKQEQGLAFRKDPAFQAAINKAITEMKADGTLKSISEKWFGVDVSE